MLKLAELNALDREGFTRVAGPVFEHSPWVAERSWDRRPFASREELHAAMCSTVQNASVAEQLALISAHPDLVGRAVLTRSRNRNRQARASGV